MWDNELGPMDRVVMRTKLLEYDAYRLVLFGPKDRATMKENLKNGTAIDKLVSVISTEGLETLYDWMREFMKDVKIRVLVNKEHRVMVVNRVLKGDLFEFGYDYDVLFGSIKVFTEGRFFEEFWEFMWYKNINTLVGSEGYSGVHYSKKEFLAMQDVISSGGPDARIPLTWEADGYWWEDLGVSQEDIDSSQGKAWRDSNIMKKAAAEKKKSLTFWSPIK